MKMKILCVFILSFMTQLAIADDTLRQKLAAAWVEGSPWSFSNMHVSETEHWRMAADGSLEYFSKVIYPQRNGLGASLRWRSLLAGELQPPSLQEEPSSFCRLGR